MLECPICRNTKAADECKHCNGQGRVKLTTCPLDYIGGGVWTMASLARFADKGSWPITGGTLDQTESFLQFYERWTSTISRLKAEDEQGI